MHEAKTMLSVVQVLSVLVLVIQNVCCNPDGFIVSSYAGNILAPKFSHRSRNNYERLHYTPVTDTMRKTVVLHFNAFSNNFTLALKQNASTLAASCVLAFANQSVPCLRTIMYTGKVHGDNSSFIHGSLINGIFIGRIYSSRGNFIVEHADDVLHGSSKQRSHHSIIYAVYASRRKRQTGTYSPITCGNTPAARDMERLQASFDPPSDVALRAAIEDIDHLRSLKDIPEFQRDESNFYVVRTCMLYIEADHTLFDNVFARAGGSDYKQTGAVITALFNNYVSYANRVFSAQQFGGINGINFQIKTMKIFNGCSADNPFCGPIDTPHAYLSAHSTRNFSDYCAALSLTARNFGDMLGAAYLARPTMAGGICEIHRKYPDAYRSLNTAILTVLQGAYLVPQDESYKSFAHQLGHNFGAKHDYDSQWKDMCNSVNYIMDQGIGPRDKVLFSRCSLGDINGILRDMLLKPPDIYGIMVTDPKLNSRRNCFRLPDHQLPADPIMSLQAPVASSAPEFSEMWDTPIELPLRLFNGYRSTFTQSAIECWQTCVNDVAAHRECVASSFYVVPISEIPSSSDNCYLFKSGFVAQLEDTNSNGRNLWLSYVKDNLLYSLRFQGYRLDNYYSLLQNSLNEADCYNFCMTDYPSQSCIATSYGYHGSDSQCYLLRDNFDVIKQAGWVTTIRTSHIWIKRNSMRLYNSYLGPIKAIDEASCLLHCLRDRDKCAAASAITSASSGVDCYLMNSNFYSTTELGWISYTILDPLAV